MLFIFQVTYGHQKTTYLPFLSDTFKEKFSEEEKNNKKEQTSNESNRKKKNVCVQSVENILPESGVLANESCANTDNWLCMTNMENNTCDAIQGNQMQPVFKSVLARG